MNWNHWQERFRAFIERELAAADMAHDLAHVARVVANSRRLAAAEGARLAVVLPAAWLHDCAIVPKNDPQRDRASRLAGEKAAAFLREIDYPDEWIPDITHAIEAHSYSAGIPPRTLEARVVQDADRLDSLGAIGIARCLLTGLSFGAALYDPADPFAESRPLDEGAFSIDHFYVKLLKLAGQMQTAAGRLEAERRTAHMRAFLEQLRTEITF